jgi:metal-dependent amidase/aminoacylase/carboxypeptidase family protein
LVEEVREEVIGWRRYLHRNPGLSFKLKETSQLVYETLDSFGGLERARPRPASVVARLIGEKPRRTLAVQADIDALPIMEENDFKF